MIDGQNVFDKPIENSLRTYDNIRKIAIGQGVDYTGLSIRLWLIITAVITLTITLIITIKW